MVMPFLVAIKNHCNSEPSYDEQANNQMSQVSAEQASKDAQNSGRTNKKTAYDPPDKSK